MNALILVDIQNDFTPNKPGGALAVPHGNQVIEIANQLMTDFDLVIATQDWHPPHHQSFASQHPKHKVGDMIDLDGLPQILWPDHCIQNTIGAAFCDQLNHNGIHHVIQKGTDANIDSYSGFFDNGHRKATGLADLLHDHDVKEVFIMGLATDYCVKFTALDAVELGFKTHLILNGCRGVELQAGDCERAIQEMKKAGIFIAE